jgi:transcriptional regulator with PAS, ATPase and Fis domain
VEAHEDGVATSRVALLGTRGPRTGERFVLSRARMGVGGPGSQLLVDTNLPKDAWFLRVVRGRALVEPGAAPVFLAGQRVRQITPALFGEEVRCGEAGFVVQTDTSEEHPEETAFGAMVGTSPPMRRLFGVLTRIAAHDAPALLTGESGTGKELAAKGLHDAGPRAEGPFVAVNCAGIPQNLFESELFGHVKGAFTGATDKQEGAFQRANGGTLFLDEVGELPLDAQAKLLRALESGEVRKVGGAAVEYPDVRVVAATNRDLRDMVHKGTFREDLYYRLAVLTVHLPPLRDRREDIPLIAKRLLERQHPGAELTQAATKAMGAYDWPGNIRELRNVLTRAFVLTGPVIDADALSFTPGVFDRPAARLAARADDDERAAIREALTAHDGNRTLAAQALGLPRSSLLYKMRRLGLG